MAKFGNLRDAIVEDLRFERAAKEVALRLYLAWEVISEEFPGAVEEKKADGRWPAELQLRTATSMIQSPVPLFELRMKSKDGNKTYTFVYDRTDPDNIRITGAANKVVEILSTGAIVNWFRLTIGLPADSTQDILDVMTKKMALKEPLVDDTPDPEPPEPVEPTMLDEQFDFGFEVT